MLVSRPPTPELAPFIELLWASTPGGGAAGRREWVLPTGAMHIVVRLTDRPLRLFRDADDGTGTALAGSVIGGARSGPYLKDVAEPAATVGAMLKPGAAEAVIGVPAEAFAGVHTALDDVWGRGPAMEARERLEEAASPAARIAVFEAILVARRLRVRGVDPMVANALLRLGAAWRIGDIVSDIGCSHRHFSERFGRAVGLKPKAYARVRRFCRAIRQMAEDPGLAWADLAAAEGYADQAHFNRDFRAFAGVTPGRYRQLAPAQPHHVPLAPQR